MVDTRGNLVTDMVVGIDAFANTLHAQFDMLAIVVEPTKRGVEVYKQYQKLANDAGVGDNLFAVGNKIRNEADKSFIKKYIPENRLLGFFGDSEYLRFKDQDGGAIDVSMLEGENKAVLKEIADKLFAMKPNYKTRLQLLHNLHRRYVAQNFIKERFGDLTNQIDESFDLEKVIQKHG